MPGDQEKQAVAPKRPETTSPAGSEQVRSHLDEFFDELKRGVYRPKSATLSALQRIALAMESEDAGQIAEAIGGEISPCGHRNPPGNRFCSSCGTPLVQVQPKASPAQNVESATKAEVPTPQTAIVPVQELEAASVIGESTALPPGQHYYHHHYHHHYFSGSENGSSYNAEPRTASRDLSRSRPAAVAGLNRSESAVRQVMQDWAQACNTKQLEDVLSSYSPDALVMRPNVQPMRGAGVIREFFVTLLESGLGEVEFEPARTEVLGEIAFEAGRCQMLVPTAAGKRREERGKYLIVLSRQSGEWKIVADSWSSDLTLGTVMDGDQGKTSAAKNASLLRKS